MSVTVTATPTLVSKARGDNQFIISDPYTIANRDAYFRITITYNSVAYLYLVFPNAQGVGIFDVRGFLEKQLVDSVSYEVSAFENNTIPYYNFTVSTINSGLIISTSNEGTFYFLNGSYQTYEGFDIDKYYNTLLSEFSFLNNYIGDIECFKTSHLECSCLSAISSTGIKFEVKLINGTTQIVNKVYSLLEPAETVTSFNISPSVIGIDVSTIKEYSVSLIGVNMVSLNVRLINEDVRFNRKYMLYWQNENGATNAIPINLQDKNSLKVSRSEYENNNRNINYRIESEESFTLLTNTLSESQSFDLKSLWESPKIVLYNGVGFFDINIANSNIPIQRKKTGNMLSYSIEVNYSEKRNTKR